jgi:16S rRNA (uracil1498-N3)-methyltransferase
MTRRRFYAPVTSFAANSKSVKLEADEARHLRDVLRLKPGDEVTVFDGAGREFQCSVVEVRREETQLAISHQIEPARPESPLRITLALSLLKADKFDLVVQKATELGVFSIVPVTTKRADIKLRDESDASKRVTRWQRIAMEAAKQSGRALVPEICMPAEFEEFISTSSAPHNVFFTEREGQSLRDAKLGELSSVVALIGPEGGWTDEEIALAKDNQWKLVTLGGRTLRAETAAITVTALLQHLYGDLI